MFYPKHTFIISYIILFYSFFLFSDENVVLYHFSPAETPIKNIQVTLEFKGEPSGTTNLILPNEWADQKELHKEIYDLKCIGHEIESTDNPHIKTITHNPDEFLKVHYKLRLNCENISVNNCYRPIGNQDYFFFIGYGLFIFPQDFNRESKITLDWSGYPSSWNLANSFGVKQSIQHLSMPLHKLSYGAYMGGDFRIISCGESSNPILIASRGKFPFSDEEFVYLVEPAFKIQRAFWKDFDFPYYLISAIPIDQKYYYRGTGLKNTFSLFLGEQDLLKDVHKDLYIEHLKHLISHEHFHTWNGGKICSSEKAGSFYWFSEGFTEYYTIKLNFLHQFISEETYLKKINQILSDYYSSPVVNATNLEIKNDFWENSSMQKLPYVRGCLLAYYLDTKIQKQSSGKFSLDDFMFDLFDFCNKNKGSFSQEDFFHILDKYLDGDIKNYALDGDTIPVEELDFYTDTQVIFHDYLGFDLYDALHHSSLQNVLPDELLNQADLTKHKLMQWSYKNNIVQIILTDQYNNEKRISYSWTNNKKVPQLVKEKLQKSDK